MERNIQTITSQLLGNEVETRLVKFLAGGWSNKNFHIVADTREMVLRIKTRPPTSPNHEPDYLAQPCAPELIAYDLETGNMLTGWVEGKLFHETQPSPEEAANFLRNIHEEITDGIYVYSANDNIAQMYKQSTTRTPEQTIFESDPWVPQRMVGCHNDLNPYNIVKTTSGFCTLDWESAGDNDPLFDLAGMCLGLRYDDQSTNQCANTYADHEVDELHFLKTRRAYQFREHSWALREVMNGNDTRDIRKQIIDSTSEIQRLTHKINS